MGEVRIFLYLLLDNMSLLTGVPDNKAGDWFSNTWYSTFGIPEQFIRRMMRTVQDPNVGIFDREGVFDNYLLPVFGAALDHSRDVRDEEFVERIKSSKFGRANLRGMKNNLGSQIGASILLDPLSYMTGGLSALGKASKGVEIMRTTDAFKKQVGAGWTSLTVADARKQIQKVISQKQTSAADARRLGKADRLLAAAPDQKEILPEISKLSGKRQLAIGVPIFDILGAKKTFDSKYETWWDLLWEPGRRGYTFAAPLGSAATKLPVFGRLLREMHGAMWGLAKGKKAGGLGEFNVDLTGAVEGPVAKKELVKEISRLDPPNVELFNNLNQKVSGTESATDSVRRRSLEGHWSSKKNPLLQEKKELETQLELAEAAYQTPGWLMGANWAELKKVAKTLKVPIKGNKNELLNSILEAKDALTLSKSAKKARVRRINTIKKQLGKITTYKPHEQVLHALGLPLVKDDELAQKIALDAFNTVSLRRDKPLSALPLDEVGDLDLKVLNKATNNFIEKMGHSADVFGLHQISMSASMGAKLRTEAAERGYFALNAFKLMKSAEDWRFKVFGSDVGRKDLAEAFNRSRDNSAKATEMVLSQMAAVAPALKATARATGFSEQEVETILRASLESAAARGEPEFFAKYAHENPKAYYRSVFNWATRQSKYLDTLNILGKDVFKERIGSGAIPHAYAESLSSLAEQGLPDEILRLHFHEEVLEAGQPAMRLEPEMRSPVEKYVLKHKMSKTKPDPLQGKKLAFIPTEVLAARREAITRKLTSHGRRMSNRNKDIAARDRIQIDKIIEWRIETGAEPLEMLKVPKKMDITSRELTGKVGVGRRVLDLDELGNIALPMARLLFDSHELRRLQQQALDAGRDFVPPVALQRRLAENMDTASRLISDKVKQGLGKEGAELLTDLERAQGQLFYAANRAGTIHPGSPIAFVHRILSDETRRSVNNIIGKIDPSLLSKLDPALAATRRRQVDHMTIEELNDLTYGLKEAGDEKYWKELTSLVEKDLGVPFKEFEESPILSVFARMGQVAEIDNTGAFINNVLNESHAVLSHTGKAPLVKAKVIAIATGVEGDPLIYHTSEKIRGRIRGKDPLKTLNIERYEKATQGKALGILVELPDGKLATMSLDQMGDGRTLWAPSLLDEYDKVKADDIGTTMANAISGGYIKRSGRSAIVGDSADLNNMAIEKLAPMLEQEIIWGESNALMGLLGSISKQHEVAGEAGQIFDNMHIFMKKFQTVFRPGFHMANASSAYFQSLTAGHGAKNTVLATMDALRFLHGSPEWAAKYDPIIRRLGDGDGLTHKNHLAANLVTAGTGSYLSSRLEWLRGLRRQGHDTGNVARIAAGTARGRGMVERLTEEGANLADHVFKVEGRSYDMSEILDSFLDANLFGTFISEGLRGSNTVPAALRRLRERSAKDGGWKAFDDLSSTAESSEVFARLLNYFAGIRSGLTPNMAAEVSAEANVRYHRLTSAEKTYAKRAFTYYTFPRKFFPFAWRKFAEDPKMANQVVSTVMTSIENGVMVNPQGNIELRMPGDMADWRLDIQRSAANLDAVVGLQAILHRLSPESDPGKEISGAPGQPAFLEFGPAVSGLTTLFGPRDLDAPSRVSELAELFPQLRWLGETLHIPPGNRRNPEISLTPVEHALMNMSTFKKVRPKHEARMYRARMRRVADRIKRDLQEAAVVGDEQQIGDLKAEWDMLSLSYQSKLGEVLEN